MEGIVVSQYLDFEGLTRYDKNVKKRTSEGYYNKDEIDNIVAGIETNILWKDAVATYADIATTYPYPQEGWTVTVLDTNQVYRYNGDEWVQISASVIPKASATNDGLMPKEMYSKVDNFGTASEKDYVTTVDQSNNLPTSKAIQTYVEAAIFQLAEALEAQIIQKVNTEDVGDASELNYTDSIPEETDKIEIKGEWYSYDDNTLFYIEGSGVDGGIDLSFVEDVNNYTLHFNFINYSTPVLPLLHLIGTKTIEGEEPAQIDAFYRDGDVLVRDLIPDEYLSGEDSGAFEITIPDYEVGDIAKLNFLIYPVVHDEGNNVDIPLVDKTKYDPAIIIHQEYDVLMENHIVTGQYGKYSSTDLPTSTAVSNLVNTVTQALETTLNDRIDEVEEKIDDYEEATDEDIESLFDFGSGGDGGVSDEDIEGLFG